jgi:hypothetical protein
MLRERILQSYETRKTVTAAVSTADASRDFA